MSTALVSPARMTDAINLLIKEDERRSRKEARAIAVQRWPKLRSPPKRAVQRAAAAKSSSIDQPKAAAPTIAEMAKLGAERDKAREQVHVLEKMLAERDGRLATQADTIKRLEGELEQIVIEFEEAKAGANPAGDGKPTQPAKPDTKADGKTDPAKVDPLK